MTAPRTATLLVFTRGPRRERIRRRLLPARAEALERQLYRRCLEEAVAAGREAGCQVAVSSPDRLVLGDGVEALPQRGEGFGARLRDAVAAARCDAKPLVIVGTDVPGLTARTVRESLAPLRDDPRRVVIGPSPDGGFYLLAATQPLDEVLAQVAWCRRDALATLLAALDRAGRPVTLIAPLADLDRRADLERLLARGGFDRGVWRAFARRLLGLLAELRLPSPSIAGPPPPSAFVPIAPSRAPPR